MYVCRISRGGGGIPYASYICWALRGAMAAPEYLRSIRGRPVCFPGSGCDWGIYNAFLCTDIEEERIQIEASLLMALQDGAFPLQGKFGAGNTSIVGIFAIMRMIGLRRMAPLYFTRWGEVSASSTIHLRIILFSFEIPTYPPAHFTMGPKYSNSLTAHPYRERLMYYIGPTNNPARGPIVNPNVIIS